MRIGIVTTAALLVSAALAAAAAAASAPVAGTTTTTRCTFTHGATQCVETVVVVRAGGCYDAGLRLWSEDDIASARTYRGNAIAAGLAGTTVNGGYADVVRPHSRLVSDSGPHAFSVSYPVEDPVCA